MYHLDTKGPYKSHEKCDVFPVTICCLFPVSFYNNFPFSGDAEQTGPFAWPGYDKSFILILGNGELRKASLSVMGS